MSTNEDTQAVEQSIFEIAIRWEPAHPRSEAWFNVPLNTRRTVSLIIHPRVSEGFLVTINEPLSSWLKISKRIGKVPFKTAVIIDTNGLDYGQGFKEELEFQVDGITIYKEPIYLTTQLYDPTGQSGLQKSFTTLSASRPRRNPFISIYSAISTTYHIGCSFVIVWILLFVICLLLIIVTAAISG
jgi:hypothetical protein